MSLSGVDRLGAEVARVPNWSWDIGIALSVLAIALAGGAADVRNDWGYYDAGQGLLFGADGLHLYALHPIVQIGPVGLSVAGIIAALPGSGQVWGLILTSLILAPTLALVRRVVGPSRACHVSDRAYLIGWPLAGLGWFPLVVIGQFGDALAVMAAVGSVALLLDHRPYLSGALLSLGIAAKPWALVFVPLLLFADPRSRGRSLLAAGLMGCVTWAPFILADQRTWAAGAPTFYVPEFAWQRLLGIGDVAPMWWRAAQLLVCWTVAVAIWTRARGQGRLNTGILVAGGVIALLRVITDLGVWPYYISAALPLVLAADLTTTRGRIPWAVVAAVLGLANMATGVGVLGISALRMLCMCSALAIIGTAWMTMPREALNARVRVQVSGPPQA